MACFGIYKLIEVSNVVQCLQVHGVGTVKTKSCKWVADEIANIQIRAKGCIRFGLALCDIMLDVENSIYNINKALLAGSPVL